MKKGISGNLGTQSLPEGVRRETAGRTSPAFLFLGFSRWSAWVLSSSLATSGLVLSYFLPDFLPETFEGILIEPGFRNSGA